MAKTKTVRKDDPEQSKLFVQRAREIEADEKHSAADRLIGALAKMKPKPHKAKRGK
jgi:hypothetical protein